MKDSKELSEVKKQLSKRLLTEGLRGGVLKLHATRNLNKAVASARHNVHAVGIGQKIVNGKPTDTKSIRIYVVQKLPTSLIRRRDLLPKEMDGFPTDVIETPPAFVFAGKKRTKRIKGRTVSATCSVNRQEKQRPVVAGISTSHFQVTAGTLSYFCTSSAAGDNPAQKHVFSNNHVFANVNKGKMGDALYQPGAIDGGTNADTFAVLQRFVKIDLGGTVANHVDAALGKLTDGIRTENELCTVGKVTSTALAEELMYVRKHGRTTGYTEGQVTDTFYDVLVGMDHSDPDIVAKFEDQVRIEVVSPFNAFGLGGDSGSLVVDRKKLTAVGLYFAGPENGVYGIANQINRVLEELQIQLIL